jgi:hypothetical protein
MERRQLVSAFGDRFFASIISMPAHISIQLMIRSEESITPRSICRAVWWNCSAIPVLWSAESAAWPMRN